jgi:N utilization substance protein B
MSRPAGFNLTSRRAARERALELLYEAEAKDSGAGAVIDALPLAPDPYAELLVRGVQNHQDAIDQRIDEVSVNWRLSRMPPVDRALLRLGVFELAHRPDVPAGVVLAEAVELASLYSTEASGRFVNGVLSRLAGELRPDERVTPAPDASP